MHQPNACKNGSHGFQIQDPDLKTWACSRCGAPFKPPTFPRTLQVQKLEFILDGKPHVGEIMIWHDGKESTWTV